MLVLFTKKKKAKKPKMDQTLLFCVLQIRLFLAYACYDIAFIFFSILFFLL